MAKVKTDRNTPIKPSARQKLESSQLRLTQLELMGADVNIDAFKLEMHKKGIMPVDVAQAIESADVSRTVRGASTFKVPVLDRDRKLLNGGGVAHGVDVNVDGLWFRTTGFDKSQDTITLGFEDREVAVLRTYAKPIKAGPGTSRSKMTRAEFILKLIQEVTEIKIPYVIPELQIVQPIGNTTTDMADNLQNQTQRAWGIPKFNDLMVNTAKMSPTQAKIANTILDVANSLLVPRPIMVMAIMCAIQESTLANLQSPLPGATNYISSDPNGNPVGVFQQIPKWWSKLGGASRDVASDAKAFIEQIIKIYNTVEGPRLSYASLIERVQNSGNGAAYAAWRTQAERIVTAYGMDPPTQAEANSQWAPQNLGSGEYEFYRGIPPSSGTSGWLPENSWNCIQRLAREVGWYAFFVSGTFYYMSGPQLMAAKPRMRITEGIKGVDWIDGNYDANKKVATLSVTCRLGRWSAPPGSIVELYDMGPLNGKWICAQVDRSLFNDNARITIEKPDPKLPEPVSDGLGQNQSGAWTPPTPPKRTDNTKRQRQYRVGSRLVQPVVKGFAASPTHGGYHVTSGLPGYPAYDFWGKPGDPVVAPENGQIIRFSGHNPADGPYNSLGLPGGRSAAGGPLGWSIYLQGDSGAIYFMTHLETILGAKFPPFGVNLPFPVAEGLVIATIADYDKWGCRSHTHVGVNSDASGAFTIYDLGNASLAAQG